MRCGANPSQRRLGRRRCCGGLADSRASSALLRSSGGGQGVERRSWEALGHRERTEYRRRYGCDGLSSDGTHSTITSEKGVLVRGGPPPGTTRVLETHSPGIIPIQLIPWDPMCVTSNSDRGGGWRMRGVGQVSCSCVRELRGPGGWRELEVFGEERVRGS